MQASKYLLLSIFILFCTQIMIKLRLQSCSGRFRGLDTPFLSLPLTRYLALHKLKYLSLPNFDCIDKSALKVKITN